MSTLIQLSPASGITVGTTAVTSGTNTRLLLQVGSVVQQSAMLTLNDTGVAGSTTANFANTFRRVGNNFEIYCANGATNMISSEGGGSAINFTSTFQNVHTTGNNHNFRIGTASPVSAMYINSSRNIGIGTTSPQASLDVRAQGALSTDIAFRVRNSADTQNSFEINGLGQGRIKSTGFTPRFAVGYDWFGTEVDAFIFTQNLQNSRGQQWTFDAGYNGSFEGLQISNDLTGNNKGQFTIQLNNFCFGTNMLNNDTGQNERRVLRIANGVAPTTSKADEFKFYSADIVAGNAAPHFRTENGNIIKLYQQSSSGITTVAQLVTVLQNLGLLS